VFNRAVSDPFAHRFAAPAQVLRLSDGAGIGRRGMMAGRSYTLGRSAALLLDGITVVVASDRRQCLEPAYFEMFGLDIGRARAAVVKSRGHFRAGFDEFFRPERILEVDAPGLTSPVLSRFQFRHLPRPVVPLDDDVAWTPALHLRYRAPV
jgi:microcystin degradation protein MlrC